MAKEKEQRVPRTIRFWKSEDSFLEREAKKAGKSIPALVREFVREKMILMRV